MKYKKLTLPEIRILKTKVTPISINTLHKHIEYTINQENKKILLNVNVNCINLAYNQKWLRQFINDAYIVFCDGAGVMLGAWILGYSIPQRITYADWIWELSEFAEKHNYTCYFLGAKEGVAEKAATNLKKQYPGLNIVGVHHGYFQKTCGHPENETVIKLINKAQPNILIVGFGMPLQEHWLMENWQHIDANVALTGGAVFDYASGNLQRAPQWMTNHGLEWFGRFIIEPRRLWKRYFLGNPLFLWRIIQERFRLLLF